MKKRIVLVFLVLLAAGGIYVRSLYNKAGEVAEPDVVKDLSDKEIREGLLSSDVKTRMDAFGQLGKLGEKERRAALLSALEAEYAPTRLTALSALARDFATDGEVVGWLLQTAKDDLDSDVREAAFGALTRSGDPRALDLAVKILGSTDATLSLKLRAAMTLDRLTGRETAKDLAGSLEEAEAAADDLSMEWDDWLEVRRGRLAWDAEKGHFTEKE